MPTAAPSSWVASNSTSSVSADWLLGQPICSDWLSALGFPMYPRDDLIQTEATLTITVKTVQQWKIWKTFSCAWEILPSYAVRHRP